MSCVHLDTAPCGINTRTSRFFLLLLRDLYTCGKDFTFGSEYTTLLLISLIHFRRDQWLCHFVHGSVWVSYYLAHFVHGGPKSLPRAQPISFMVQFGFLTTSRNLLPCVAFAIDISTPLLIRVFYLFLSIFFRQLLWYLFE